MYMTTLRQLFEAENLILVRKRSGLGQTQLGLRVGVSRSSIADWESGVSTPQLNDILALASAMGVPVSALISEERPSLRPGGSGHESAMVT
jgi:transcriptional regulator with XRE-family HTH domain